MTLPLRRAVAAGLAGPSLLLLASGCGGPAGAARSRPATVRPERPYVLVSGRDDHGLQELASVPLVDGPGSSVKVGYVPDGTLAKVLSVSGTWLHVAPVTGPVRAGWVDDYWLRGVVHLVGAAPSCRVSVAGHRLAAGEQAEVLAVHGATVTVRLVRRPGVRGTVPLRYVRELPPSPDDPCPRR